MGVKSVKHPLKKRMMEKVLHTQYDTCNYLTNTYTLVEYTERVYIQP